MNDANYRIFSHIKSIQILLSGMTISFFEEHAILARIKVTRISDIEFFMAILIGYL